MALELMDMLVQFLCPTSNSASLCQNFISAHQSVMPPFGQYIYFLFFPTVFLLLFLWIVFKDAIKANKGISLIATIAVYVFIIIQGLYPIFLALGELWIIVIFLLGFLYFIIHRFRGEGGGGGKGGGIGGLVGGGIKAVGGWASGDISSREKDIKDRIKELEDAAKNLDAAPKGTQASSEALIEFRAAEREARSAVEELKEFNVRFPVFGSKGRSIVKFTEHYEKQIRDIVHRERKKAA